MLDCVIRGGSVVDGTGTPARRADVGIRERRIVAIGDVTEDATDTIDAGGLVVAPGIVDPHTHYDAQLFWDPAATPSNLHGVTSMIAGNCGFTLAPLAPSDADYLRRMMAKVEGMPLPALEQGVPWSWSTFADYLGALDGRVALNVGFMVGHCALRRNVMGADSVGNEATPAQLDAITALLHDSLAAGGLGFSTTLSFTHSDGDGQPVASRWASNEEVLSLCRAVSQHEGTSLEYVTDGCLRGFTDAEVELMAEMTLAGRRALNWNVLTIDSEEPQRYRDQVGACENARSRGGTVIALTMPILVEMNMSFLNYCALFMMPGWSDVMNLPVAERIAKLRDPAVRKWMDERARSPEAGVFSRLASWDRYQIGDTFSAANDGLKGRIIGDIATSAGKTPFDTLVDIVIEDDLRTVLWPLPTDGDDRVMEDARRGLGPPVGDDRRLGCGRAPRPDVRCALSHVVPGRLAARPPPRIDGAVRATDDAGSGGALRAARPRNHPGRQSRRPLRVRSRDRGYRRGEAGRRSARRHVAVVRGLGGREPRDRQRHDDRGRRCRNRRPPRHGAALRPRHLHRADPCRRLSQARSTRAKPLGPPRRAFSRRRASVRAGRRLRGTC